MRTFTAITLLFFALAFAAQGSPLILEEYGNSYSGSNLIQSITGQTDLDGWILEVGTWSYDFSEGSFKGTILHNSDYSVVRNMWSQYSFSTSSWGTWVRGTLGSLWFSTWWSEGVARTMWESGEYNADITAEGEPVRWGSNWWTEILISFSDWGSAGGNTDTGESWQLSGFSQTLDERSGGGSWSSTPSETPEPATWALVGGVLLALARKKKLI